MKIILLLIFFLLPINVSANIICNDGSTSPSCSVCSRGCCSKHGGCSNNTQPSNFTNSIELTDTGKSDITNTCEDYVTEISKLKRKVSNYEIYIAILAVVLFISICAYKGKK